MKNICKIKIPDSLTVSFLFNFRQKYNMEENVGDTDGIVRILVGAVLGLASLGILLNMVPLDALYSPVLGVLSIVLLATGFTSRCALYSAVGVNTNK